MFDNKVSIIIPSYNRSHLIGETLNSVIAQTYTNWECIIIDDGSTDSTEELIANYIKKDSRFQYYHRPKDRLKGANACRNYGYEISNGNYIKWFDSDDIMHPDFLEKQVRILEQFSELDFCVCQSLTFFENSNEKLMNKANRNPTHSLILSYLVKNHYFFTGAPLWKKEYLYKKDLFDEALSDAHETDFHFRMLLYFPKYIYLKDFLFSIRRGNDSITQNSINKKASLESRIIFFYKAKILIVKERIKDDSFIMNEYCTYRISGAIYELCMLENRFFIFRKFRYLIFSLLFQKNLKLISRMSLFIGFLFLLISKKGYSFLKENLQIREQIVN